MPKESAELDSLIFSNRKLEAVQYLRQRGLSVTDATEAFIARYRVLRQLSPGRFDCGDGEYWKGLDESTRLSNAIGPAPQNWLQRLATKAAIGVGIVIVCIFLGAIFLQFLAVRVARAPSDGCRFRLMRIAFTAMLWAEQGHSNRMPADFTSFTNLLSARDGPEVLHCPMDDLHTIASAWSQLTDSNISFVILGGGESTRSTNVFVICPIHDQGMKANGKTIRKVGEAAAAKP